MQAALLRFWTQVSMSISYTHNHCTWSTSSCFMHVCACEYIFSLGMFIKCVCMSMKETFNNKWWRKLFIYFGFFFFQFINFLYLLLCTSWLLTLEQLSYYTSLSILPDIFLAFFYVLVCEVYIVGWLTLVSFEVVM